jgi:hypothetical protein
MAQAAEGHTRALNTAIERAGCRDGAAGDDPGDRDGLPIRHLVSLRHGPTGATRDTRAVVGPTSGAGVRAEMRAASEAGVQFRSYPTAQAAVSAISDQVVFGALVIERAPATLLVSSHACEPRWW